MSDNTFDKTIDEMAQAYLEAYNQSKEAHADEFMTPEYRAYLDQHKAAVEPGGESGSEPDDGNLLVCKGCSDWLAEAAEASDPSDLWKSMWFENEVCCLFADSNVGKSIYAVQIAEHIACSRRVIYFDFELSSKQFQLRYTSEDGRMYRFQPNLMRAEIDLDRMRLDIDNFEEDLMAAIEQLAVREGIRVLIIDNLSFICNSSDKSDIAGKLMMRLLDLKRRLQLSILVLAHTPKRALGSPITQNDLAGSKKLINFCDSAFAIGKCLSDPSQRYIKQIKVRNGSFMYDANNVMVATIEKVESMLQFVTQGYACEDALLKAPKAQNEFEQQVTELYEQGLNCNQIATRLNEHRMKVSRVLKRYEDNSVS